MEGYIERLRRETAEKRAQRQADTRSASKLDPRADLRARIRTWYDSLPPEDRLPRYRLVQIAPLFHCTLQQLGETLAELGWRRTRVWRDDGPFCRYWMPPGAPDTLSAD